MSKIHYSHAGCNDATKPSPEAMDFFAQTGMFDMFDIATKKCLAFSEATSASCSNSDAETLTKCASVLTNNGYEDKARSIYNKLNAALPNLSIQNRMRVLVGRASMIGQIDGPAAALDCYKQLAAYCTNPGSLPQDFLLDSLQSVVQGAVKNKNFEIAELAQLHIVDLQKEKRSMFRHLQGQDAVAALLKLADIYEQENKSSKARDALEQARSLYNEKLNLQEQVLLERTGSLCASEVELRLAYSYAISKQFDKASEHVDRAQKLVSEALGVDSRANRKINQIKKSFLAKKDENYRASLVKTFATFFAAQNTNEAGAIQIRDPADARLAINAFDGTEHNASNAISLIETRLQHELVKSTHSADDTTRLIILIGHIKTPETRKTAETMLRQLDVILDQPDAQPSTNCLYQKAELALLTDDESAGAVSSSTASAWNELERVLKNMQLAQFHSRENEIDHDRLNRLLSVSYIYAESNEPEKAHRLLQHAINHQSVLDGRDASLIAYDALLYLLANNMTEAQKPIDFLISGKADFGYGEPYMLIALSSTLYHTGRGDLSLKLLNLEPKPGPGNLNTKKILACQRALIKYEQGAYQDALSELGDNENTVNSISGRQMPNLRFLKAQLLAKTGQTNEAILAYLKVGGESHVQLRSYYEAVTLSKTMQSIPSSTVQALLDAAQPLRVLPENKRCIAALKDLLNIAKNQKISNPSVNNLDTLLAYLDSGNSNIEEVISNIKSRAQSLEDARKPVATQWASLARLCFDQKRYTEGTGYMLHALQTESAETFNSSMYHPGNMRGDLGFDVLLKAKEYDDAEKILKQCVAARKSPGLAKTAYIEKSLLAELFIEEDKYDEAKKWADALLATFSEDNGICPPKGGNMRGYLLFDIVDKFTAKKQFGFAQQVLE